MPRKPLPLDWMTLAAAGVAGVLTGVGKDDLNAVERLALGVTVGVTILIVLHIAVRLLGGKRRGP